MKTAEKIKNKTALELLNEAEENIAYNLCWLNDQFDLEIRQGNKEVIERLAMIDRAWKDIVYIVPKIESMINALKTIAKDSSFENHSREIAKEAISKA